MQRGLCAHAATPTYLNQLPLKKLRKRILVITDGMPD